MSTLLVNLVLIFIFGSKVVFLFICIVNIIIVVNIIVVNIIVIVIIIVICIIINSQNCLGQGHGAIYDAKWCPDKLHVAASDSHGHVLFFGTTSSEPYEVLFSFPPTLWRINPSDMLC